MVSMSSSSVTPFCLARGQVEGQLFDGAAGDPGGDGGEAPVALGQLGALPDLVEEDLVGVVDEPGREVAERALAAGPWGRCCAGSRWLLKMHGDMETPESAVLTRGQFVDFTGTSGPAGAVLQALLLTRHPRGPSGRRSPRGQRSPPSDSDVR